MAEAPIASCGHAAGEKGLIATAAYIAIWGGVGRGGADLGEPQDL